jgi:hypothetical protein
VGNIKHPFWALVLLITTEAIMKATTAQKIERATQAYNRAINSSSVQNELIVIQEFAKRGITATPRKDVWIYDVWLYVNDAANGKQKRQVRKGEKSVKVRTMYEEKKNGVKTGKLKPATACLFHISQTDPVETV